MNKTSIEWTDFTWNPIRARNTRANRLGTFCTRISPGCKNCYASVINRRFGTGLEYEVPELKHHEFFVDERILGEPLRRKKPALIFVGDMFDLFHGAIPTEFVERVWDVMQRAQNNGHTFQVLTKRAERMSRTLASCKIPLWNVWLGVSVEDQQRADERIPHLLNTPAAVRFLSVEPQLEAIELVEYGPEISFSYLRGFDGCEPAIPAIDWVICGGESGPGARPFNLAWAKSLLDQCRAAGVPFFMKQIGSNPLGLSSVPMCDRKGGDPAEWPEHLRVREFPALKSEAVPA